jgi:hypothetical protein
MGSMRHEAATRRLISLAVGAAALVGLGAGAAAAHTTSYSTGIQISAATADDGHIIVSGFVSSENQKCLGNRLVKLYAVEPADGGGQTLTLLDTDRTSQDGAWAAMADDKPSGGELRAVVTKKNIGRRGHKHICARAEQTTV